MKYLRPIWMLGIASTLTLAGCNSSDLSSSDEGTAAAPRSSRSVPTWSIQYEGKIVPRGKDYHIVDLFDVSSSDLATLRSQGTKPIAYFSSQYESWRSDSAKFPKADIGKKLGNWKGENWINPKSAQIRAIMISRMDLAKRRGFHGVDVDNVDFYLANTGFDNSRATAIEYIRFLAREAHKRGLIFGLKNAVELVPTLNRTVDFFMNEEAHEYGDTGYYSRATKPVFCVEYKHLTRSTPGMYTIYKQGAVMDGREVVVPSR